MPFEPNIWRYRCGGRTLRDFFMSSSDCYLSLSVVAVLLTFSASFRVRRIGFVIIPYFFFAWVTIELAWLHILTLSVISIWFISQGVLATAAGINGFILAIMSIIGLSRLHRQSQQCATHYEQVLEQHFDTDYINAIDPKRRQYTDSIIDEKRWLKPFNMRRQGVCRLRNIRYGEHARHILDIYQPSSLPETPCPVLFQIHGGGWTIGTKDHQGLPLMNHLASRGWLCVAINYRLSPQNRFPAHIEDAKRALAWVKEHISEYGGDRHFVIATGGSAGGHLSSLLALSANQTELQPGFEEADTSVQGCVPFYGVYDFIDGNADCDALPITDFLADVVMPQRPHEVPQLWQQASPTSQAHSDAPPFFVIHGSHDSLAIVEEARRFVAALRATSQNPVLYAELEGAQHAFEIFHSVRTEHTLTAVCRFVEYLYGQYQKSKLITDKPQT